jgi:hypothetical protein
LSFPSRILQVGFYFAFMVMSTVFQQAVRPLFDYAANAAPAVEILRSLPVEAQRESPFAWLYASNRQCAEGNRLRNSLAVDFCDGIT